MIACTLLAAGCNAVVNFGDFKFASGDAGEPNPPSKDAGDMKMPDKDAGMMSQDAGTPPKVDAGPKCAAKETACADRTDNDCDGLEDCADPDCGNEMRCCKPTEIPETSCADKLDDDCDGKVDCMDSSCTASKDCCMASGAELGNSACSDGVDNDCDGVLDCQETACAAQSVCCQATGSERDATTCGDGMDNDCDGKLDCADPDCAVASACCTKDSAQPTETTLVACSDGKDNDCDGVADCRDSDCDNVDICKLCAATATMETSCTDRVDNDCDKDRDCMDPECAADPACCVATGAENSPALCVDGEDNDCDGHVDCTDPECAGTVDCCVSTGQESDDVSCRDNLDNDCDGLVNCQDPGCGGLPSCCTGSGSETGAIACNDGVDNDCDTKKDCQDSDCMGLGAGCSCIPTGSEGAQPNDGKDNDCNGFVDIPLVSSAYPTQGLPSGGPDVALTFVPSIVAGATLECNTRRQGQQTPAQFTGCPGNGNTVNPQQGVDASADGAWITEVRWRFPDGARSETFPFKYYVHHTLYKAKRCTSAISDAQWFAKARDRLLEPKPGTFKPDSPADTSLINPFVRVTYQPPNANNIFYAFEQDGTQQTVEMWSLRRRFALSADNRLLLVTRNFASSRTGNCFAASFRVHNAHRMYNNQIVGFSCEAIVLNRQGAGVCLHSVTVSGGSVVPDFARDSNDDYADMLGWKTANKFMWRQLVEQVGRDGGDVHRFEFEPSRNYRNFTPKCLTQACANRDAIYLPDRGLFP